MWYSYTGFDSKGVPRRGEIEGSDEEDVILHLRAKGVFGVELAPKGSENEELQIVDANRASRENIKTVPREGILGIRYSYENLRNLLRSLLLDVGVTEDVLRGLIIDLKSDDVEKQRKVIEYIEDMGFEKEALELSKAFLFKTDFHNTQNPEDPNAKIDKVN
jgi:hypothetical protein